MSEEHEPFRIGIPKHRVIKGADGIEYTVSDDLLGAPHLVTFDCGVCGYGFLTEAPMEECGKQREDCPRSEAALRKYRAALEAVVEENAARAAYIFWPSRRET